MFSRILIANRGEIACRIARTCRRIGVEYVAVYSEADRGALHLEGAVETVCIGPGPANKSYLNIARLVEVASTHKCQAVHPGYGFLSENAEFARAVENAGLVFIGPSAETIDVMGDKARSKALMRAAGVPVVPGGNEASDQPERIVELAAQAGFPALLKPAAGGGGKGMSIVKTQAQLAVAAEATIRQARASFGDGRLLVERYVTNPRHIEVQIFGDAFGNIVHLFERECSLQRRHQKVIEEAPAPNLPEEIRNAMRQAALEGSRALSYRNAGTFEFIYSPEAGEFFFLEVNTRLQVEHPVTEAITGLDLVEMQLRVAAGEPLGLNQGDIQASGHAMEARIYAEDPIHDFRPAPGLITRAAWPETARVDTGFGTGSRISPFYDPLIAKVIVHAPDRDSTVDAMKDALLHMEVCGVTTNAGFLVALLDEAEVRRARADTGFIERRLTDLTGHSYQNHAAVAAAVTQLAQLQAGDISPSPWVVTESGFDREALAPQAPLGTVMLVHNDKEIAVGVLARSGTRVRLACAGHSHLVEVDHVSPDGALWRGRLEGLRWSALNGGESIDVQVNGWRWSFLSHNHSAELGHGAGGTAAAPLPGIVAKVAIKVGDKVTRGQVLAIVEAMKMENPVVAPFDGTVEELLCNEGDTVSSGQIIAHIAVADE